MPTTCKLPTRLSLLCAGLLTVLTAACQGTGHATCCGGDSACGDRSGRAHDDQDERDEHARGRDAMDDRDDTFSQAHGQRQRGNGDRRGRRDDEDQARDQHAQEDRIHLEIHERLDRLTERLAELEHRLDLTEGRRRAARSLR